MDNRKRIEWIDCAKGLGIILMVLGHMQNIPEIVICWIYSFHMPLFFVASGYFFSKAKPIECFKKTLRNVLKPYIIYSSIFLVLDVFFTRDIEAFKKSLTMFLSGQGAIEVLWFFWVLFLVQNIYNFIHWKSKKTFLLVVICALIGYVLTEVSMIRVLKVETALVSLLFYATGNYLNKIKVEKLFETLREKRELVWLSGTLLVQGLSTYANFYLYGYRIDLNYGRYCNLILTYISAMSGTLWMFYVTYRLDRFSITKPVKYVGRNSLYFYPLMTYIPVKMTYIYEMIYNEAANTMLKLASKLFGLFAASFVIKLSHLLNSKRIKERRNIRS